MRILVWPELFHPHIGGIEVRSGELVAELCRRGHECTVITSRIPETLPIADTWHSAPVHRLQFRRAIATGDLRELQQALATIRAVKATFQPDVELVFVSGPLIALQRIASRQAPRPTIASLQGRIEEYTTPGGAVRQHLKSCELIVTVSHFLHQAVCREMPELAPKTIPLLNSLPVSGVPPLPLPQDPPIIMTLGRLIADKGFDLALRAMQQVHEKHPAAKMIVAGDGPERQPLEAVTSELGLIDCVHFTGWIPPAEVPDFLNRASVVVMPSRWEEAFGLVSLQAAQMGRPVVGTRVGALPEIVVHGKTGLLADKKDFTGLAEALDQLLSCPALMQEMGDQARARALTDFSFERYVTLYEELFDRAIRSA
ncbi:glycosyltransferase family 4 protein [Verrucomicrobium sp. BvORR034]|uniref:glycosyltransferase family 4 protein n=1 Tax=Verrucomicrobium sp. BvORR034 TaxID=1396418 RepID=UPI0009E06213|nr:glycosyltransferase family 4 protein [Verrucomicrobium sp. BvORR034]